MPSRRPVVVIVGRPNVGKSSLFNRLTRSADAIVDPTPGVTRDRHYAGILLDDRAVLLVDTGGIENLEGGRQKNASDDNHLQGLMQEQTLEAVQEADVVVCLFDARAGVTAMDREIVGMLRRSGKKILYFANKADGPAQELSLSQFHELGIDRIQPLSVAHAGNISTLREELLHALDDDRDPGDTVTDDASTSAIRVACVGRPNVGKSSLVNRILGQERMVVSEVPGTTRDAVDSRFSRQGRDYILVDTAGIRRRGKVQERLEKFSVIKTLGAIARADVALVLADVSEGLTDQDTRVIGHALEEKKPFLLLLNKWDLIRSDLDRQRQLTATCRDALAFAPYAPILQVSCKTGFGVTKIFSFIERIHEQQCRRFTTNRLNRILRDAIERHAPPLHHGKRLKFSYVTQTGTCPVSLLIMASHAEDVHFSYERYLANQFREKLGLDLVPVFLKFRQRPPRR